eukprot:GEMP01059382.1.p1 GENE.GEMP01059382.1~~GEMP01059382.1.p1  ORF type:complete len:178 (+),score=41.80 GEMP01059382.1:147-680(+)
MDPFLMSTVPVSRHPHAPKPQSHWEFEHTARQFFDLYEQQLMEIHSCEKLLTQDQETLATLIQHGAEDAVLFKQGLDLRLQEFEDDSRRLYATQRRLERILWFCEALREYELFETTGLTSANSLIRLKQQLVVLEDQHDVMDFLRFERDVEADHCGRLKRQIEDAILGTPQENRAAG